MEALKHVLSAERLVALKSAASPKRLIPIVVAAAVGAAVLLRPVPPPAAGASGWSSAAADPQTPRGRRTTAPQAMVYVAGDVLRPGVYPVRAEARTRDALALAGGAKPDADLVAVNLAAHVRDGDEIIVPVRGEPGSGELTGRGRRAGGLHRAVGSHRADGPRRARSPRGSGDTSNAESSLPDRGGGAHGLGKSASGRGSGRHRRFHGDGSPPAEVDINTADADTLAMIPGIGGGLAKRIVEFREQNGAFASIDELLDVAGITEHRLDAMLPYVVAR